MQTRLSQCRKTLDRLLEGAVVILTGILVLDVLWQVASRYVLRHPSSWTDELATLLIIWVVLLGACVAFNRKGHLGVDYFVNRLPSRLQKIGGLFVHLMIAFFAITILGVGGTKLVALTLLTDQVSPALNVKMGYVYLALPLSGLFILGFAVAAMVEQCQTEAGGSRSSREDPQ